MFVNVRDSHPEMDNRQYGYVGVSASASLEDYSLTIGNIALPLVHFIYKTN